MNVPHECRKYGRVSFLSRVSLSHGSSPAPIESSTVDISLGGVGLLARLPVAAGQPVSLAFHLRDSRQAAVVEQVPGRVVNVRSDIDGHRIRIEFDEHLKRSRVPELTRKVESL